MGFLLLGGLEAGVMRLQLSRPEAGIVTFEHRTRNQAGDVVMRARRNAMMRKRAA